MADRRQVNDPNAQRLALQPAARPVDTFVAPALVAPDTTGGSQLASALKRLNPQITGFLREERERFNEEEQEAGRRAFLENRKDFAELVRSGTIPAGASPHFQRGFRLAQLRVKGQAYQQALQSAWNSSDVKNSDDPNVLQDFIAKFTSEYMQSNIQGFDDAEVIEVLEPAIERANASITQQHIAHRTKVVQDGYLLNTERLMHGSIEEWQGLSHDPETDGGVAYKTLADSLMAHASELNQDGVAWTDINKLIVDAVVAKALESNDTTLLDVLDHIKTGSGALGSTTYAVRRKEATEDSILSERNAIAARARTARKERNEEISDKLLAAADRAAEAGDFRKVSEIKELLRRVDPEAVSTVNGFVKFYHSDAGQGVSNDPRDQVDVENVIYSNSTAAEKRKRLGEMASAGLLNRNELSSAMRTISTLERNKEKFNDRFVQETLRDITDIVKKADPVSGVAAPERLFLSLKARNMARAMILARIAAADTRQEDLDQGQLIELSQEVAGKILSMPQFQFEREPRQLDGQDKPQPLQRDTRDVSEAVDQAQHIQTIMRAGTDVQALEGMSAAGWDKDTRDFFRHRLEQAKRLQQRN